MTMANEATTFWATLWKITQVIMVCVVPWAVWTTRSISDLQATAAVSAEAQRQIAAQAAKIAQHDTQIVELVTWKNIGPRFTPTDAENLRLRILNEIQQQQAGIIADINTRLVQLQRDVIELQVMVKAHYAAPK